MVLSLIASAVVSGAPMADLWPFQAQRQADGSIVFSYDLTAIKASPGFIEAKGAHGDAAVKAFLASLPRTVTVLMAKQGPLTLSAGQGLERSPLATSFATTPDGPLSTDNPLGKKASARLLAPLDPRTPKLLVGAELPLWLAREIEQQALAAIELDTEWLRRELWTKTTERALAKARTSAGDTREGAFALAVRLLAASSCGDPARMPALAKNDGELKTAVEAELVKLSNDHDSVVAPAPWSWTPELTCAWLRSRAVGRPFEPSRAGTAAALVFLELLDQDPKLKNLWERARQRRDRFVGPSPEPLLEWKAAAGDLGKALDGLGEFLDALPMGDKVPPPLLASPKTPCSSFVAGLTGAERTAAIDELIAAVSDGRVQVEPSSWPLAREAALAALLTDGGKAVQFDSGWRERLAGIFATFHGAHREARRGGLDGDDEPLERTELKLRLNVPPLLEVEPTARAFELAAASLEALSAAVAREGLSSLKGLGPDGKRGGEPSAAQARRLAPVLRGLAALAHVESSQLDPKVVGEARRFLATWRSAPGVSRDVRATAAWPWAASSERPHAAIVGVSRRELRVGYVAAPTATVQGEAKPFEINVAVEQRYLVPVLVTSGAVAPHAVPAAALEPLKRALDASGRDPERAEGILHETLHRESSPGVNAPD